MTDDNTRAATAAETVAQRLTESGERSGTLLCVGLDPQAAMIPREIAPAAAPGERIQEYLSAVLDTIAESGCVPAAFKPNIAYFHRIDRPRSNDFSGSRALAFILDRIAVDFPGTPVILDAKRGDIAGTSTAYAEEAFDAWGAAAVTVSPFMGDDSVVPFLDAAADHDGWVYLLNRTSNPGAERFQRLECDGQPLYRTVATVIAEWQQRYGSAGAVIGATAPEELTAILGFYRSTPLPILIPGVGAQGGSAAAVLGAITKAVYPAPLVRVNASRGIVFPWGNNPPSEGIWRSRVSAAYTNLHQALRWR